VIRRIAAAAYGLVLCAAVVLVCLAAVDLARFPQ
jgi:hypothetical protein